MKMSAFFRSQKCDLRLLLVSRSNWSKFQNSENRRAYCCDAREEEEEEEEEDILSQQQQNNKKKISKKKSHTKNTPIF